MNSPPKSRYQDVREGAEFGKSRAPRGLAFRETGRDDTAMRWMLAPILAAASMAGPINDACPVDGQKVDAGQTSEVKVGFCCANCKGRFDRDPLATLNKLDKIPTETCPLSGKPVADATSTVVVAFCRAECKGKFDGEPGKYLSKIKPAEKK